MCPNTSEILLLLSNISHTIVFAFFLQQKNFVNFQILCVIVALLSCGAMCYSGLNMTVAKKYQPEFDEKGIIFN